MNKRTILLGTLAAGGLSVWMASGGWRQGDIEFTKPALAPSARVDLRADLSTVYVSIPVELGGVAQQAEAELPAKLPAVVEWLANAACAKRNQWVECNSARLEGSITRNGPVELQIETGAARLRIPVKYDLAATGIGWARYLTERKTGEFVMSVPFSIGVSTTGTLDVSARDEAHDADSEITLLKGTVKLGRLLEPRIRPAIKGAEEMLRRTLAQVPARAALNSAWSALNKPLELGQGSGLWLNAMPEHYSSAGFVSAGGQNLYRLAIAARLTVAETERPTSAAQRRTQPVLSQNPLPPGPTRVRVAMGVDLEAMRQAAAATFVTGEVFESRADRFTEPVKVKVLGAKVYPAQRQIGLELDLDVATLKGATYSGKAHLVGRPVLDAAAGVVSVSDVSFPPVSGKDASGKSQGVPRLGTEPFASKFASAARLDISQTLKDALPRAAHMLNQPLDKDLALASRLPDAVPASLELTRDGAILLVDLTGELSFVYTGSPEPVAAAHETAAVEPVKDSSSAKSATTAAPVASLAKSKAIGAVKRSLSPKRPFNANPKPAKPSPMFDIGQL